MTQQPQQLAFEATHRNHFLFSDYYLDNRVRDRPEWDASHAGVQTAFDAIAERWDAYTPNEQATEREWIRPVLDILAFLAEQMIPMHEEQQQVVEDFCLDLKGVVADADTFETLRTRGKWEQSLWKYVEACRLFVAQLAGSVASQSDLVHVYRRHAPRYQDLADRIARTDDLIDQIVYRLYGLTEEEIAVVEGSNRI